MQAGSKQTLFAPFLRPLVLAWHAYPPALSSFLRWNEPFVDAIESDIAALIFWHFLWLERYKKLLGFCVNLVRVHRRRVSQK